MSNDGVVLQRYLDGDLTPHEAEQLRARFAHEPELNRQLAELRQVGRLLRLWAQDVQQGPSLVEPTLRRVQAAKRQRARHATLGFALAAALVVALPFASLSRIAGAPVSAVDALTLEAVGLDGLAQSPGAAIERLEAAEHAQVFVVGATSTPVVWLSDPSDDDADGSPGQDPG